MFGSAPTWGSQIVTIEFTCVHCGKALSTGDEKAGRKAKCPGCSEPIQVPTINTEGVDLSATVVAAAPARSRGGSRKCPMCGHVAAPSDESCSACGEELTAEERDVDRGRTGEAVAFDLGTVLSRSWQIFKQDMGLVVGGQLVAGLLGVSALVPALGLGIAGAITADQGGDEALPVVIALLGGAFVLGIIGIVVALWLAVGAQLLLLGLVRGKDVSFSTLFEGKRFLGRYFLCSILYNIMVQIGSQLCVIPGLLVTLFFWPYQYILIDEDRPHIQSLLDAPKLASKSWLMTIVLAIVSAGINLLGVLALFIGVLFTAPYVMLAWCVAYDEMLDRMDDDEEVEQAQYS